MGKAENIALLRLFLDNEFKIMPGKNPSRPAPAHILNGFAKTMLGGTGSVDKELHSLQFPQSSNELIGRVLKSGFTPEDVKDLSDTLHALFNSDRRTLPTFHSQLLLSREVISSDPSDYRYGEALVNFFTAEEMDELRPLLIQLLDETQSSDIISKSVGSLVRNLKNDGDAIVSTPAERAAGERTAFGLVAFEILRSGLLRMVDQSASVDRIRNIQRLSLMISALLSIGLLYDAVYKYEISNIPDDSRALLEPAEVLGIVLYTGMPPGNSKDVRVRFAAATLTDAVRRAHRGYQDAFCEVLRSTSSVDEVVTSRLGGPNARDLIVAFEAENVLSDPEGAFSAFLTEGDIKGAVKPLAGKVGLAGPIKGTAETRFFLETSFLETLVYFFGEEGKPYSVLVDNCYQQFGIIVGNPKGMHTQVRSRLRKIAGRNIDLSKSLHYLDELLRRRLVETGLAQEFSDGHTVLRGI